MFSADYRYKDYLPVLEFTVSDYLEAYGLERTKKSRFSGTKRTEALKALKSLAEARNLVYAKTYWENGKQLYHVVRGRKPLIELLENYWELSESEARTLKSGSDLPDKLSTIIIKIGPLIMDGIKDFFVLKSTRLHKEIEEQVAQRRGSKARVPVSYYLFAEWLVTRSHETEKVARDTLVTKLNLSKWRERRKLKVAYEQIDEALEIAKGLGYLLDYEEDVFGVLTLTLNPERCQRVRLPEPEEEGDQHE